MVIREGDNTVDIWTNRTTDKILVQNSVFVTTEQQESLK